MTLFGVHGKTLQHNRSGTFEVTHHVIEWAVAEVHGMQTRQYRLQSQVLFQGVSVQRSDSHTFQPVVTALQISSCPKVHCRY
jgi:hypothetical protein